MGEGVCVVLCQNFNVGGEGEGSREMGKAWSVWGCIKMLMWER